MSSLIDDPAVEKTEKIFGICTSRQEYLETCQSLVKEYFEKNNLFVNYIRSYRPNVSFNLNTLPEKYLKLRWEILRKFRPKTSKDFEELVEKLSRIPASNVEDQEKLFRTMNSLDKCRQSPPIGVVVGFKENDIWKVGWSICHKGDQFNKYQGIWRAIKRGAELSRSSIRAVSDPAKYMSGRQKDCPHSCQYFMTKAIERINRSEKMKEIAIQLFAIARSIESLGRSIDAEAKKSESDLWQEYKEVHDRWVSEISEIPNASGVPKTSINYDYEFGATGTD